MLMFKIYAHTKREMCIKANVCIQNKQQHGINITHCLYKQHTIDGIFFYQMEFDVEMSCGSCVKKVENALKGVDGNYCHTIYLIQNLILYLKPRNTI